MAPVKAVKDVAGGLKDIFTGDISGGFEKIGGAVVNLGKTAIDVVGKTADLAITAVKDVGKIALKVFTDPIGAIKDIAGMAVKAVKFVGKAILAVGKLALKAVAAVGKLIGKAAKAVFNAVMDILGTAFHGSAGEITGQVFAALATGGLTIVFSMLAAMFDALENKDKPYDCCISADQMAQQLAIKACGHPSLEPAPESCTIGRNFEPYSYPLLYAKDGTSNDEKIQNTLIPTCSYRKVGDHGAKILGITVKKITFIFLGEERKVAFGNHNDRDIIHTFFAPKIIGQQPNLTGGVMLMEGLCIYKDVDNLRHLLRCRRGHSSKRTSTTNRLQVRV